MLDNETKRRIDSARDILVGKVPDPKSQVEQITIALIYKFMDDMDAEAEELGGVRTFFAGEFEKYSWVKLLAPGMGGFEMLALYGEAISKMPENPGIPLLFRDIFKNAYLPYRDPETLKSFLKVINDFTYDHSERLGDAFEYLLSVLGSQGDAGQFRTPRHIIDFMVAVIAPRKNETILDPACGTAGFLISAYKYVLAANTHNGLRGAGLTPDERTRLLNNIKGYDISPDMVRLSLVNLYLHGFSDPHIAEYDTLTSTDKWNEYADIIMANPPFMSPKGGIRPHKRFSVQSNRSEVLFVDYIAEHLSPTGRAAVIVPEGVIFQSGTAYKTLRKMLVDNYLVGVISLPAGVFNPYSGVKTSILWLDKSLTKKTDQLLFVKIEADGFGLGAQRREVKQNDLPGALAAITQYKLTMMNGEAFDPAAYPNLILVPKAEIAAKGEYNLSGERYRKGVDHITSWLMVSLEEAVEIESGSRQKGGAVESGIPSIGGEQIDENGNIRIDKMKYISEEHFRGMRKGILRKGDVLIVKDGATTGKTGFFAYEMKAAVNEHVFILRARETIHPYFLYCAVRADAFQIKLRPFIKGIIGGISLEISKLTIPLPPLDVQAEIVAEIEGYQKIIDGARQVVEYWKPQIVVEESWSIVKLKEVLLEKPKNGYSGKPVDYMTNLKVLSLSATSKGFLDPTHYKYLDENIPDDSPIRCRYGDVLLQRGNTRELVGTSAIFDINDNRFVYPDLMIKVKPNNQKILTKYLDLALKFRQTREYIMNNATGAAGSMPKINQEIVENIPIPLPDLATQERIVTQIEREQVLVKANRELIEIFDQKIKDRIAKVWGE